MSDPAIRVVRHPRARRMRLSLDPMTGEVRLVLPPRAALGPAMVWAKGQRAWITAQRARLPVARPIVDGMAIMVGGEALTLAHDSALPRRVVRDGAWLRCGGPAETLGARVTAWLKREALTLLRGETEEFAARLGVTVSTVGIGDPRRRWGSCASDGAIRYSWRLILAPSWVRRATVAHEVVHRVHMHHRPEFHALVETLVGRDADRSRDWLRREGAGLHWFGRASC